ncbi:uncharacterized protein BDZ99DRAFT_389169, partial [Mytilinidion resinicola]
DDCTTSTRIHAELYLVQLFHKRKLPFVDDDKFVGCSKPACYLCYEYIAALDAGFALPASHNKVYLKWAPPSLGVGGVKGKEREEKEMEGCLNRMTARVRRHVQEQVEGRMERRWGHPDSTTGVSTAVLRVEEDQGEEMGGSFYVSNEEFDEGSDEGI